MPTSDSASALELRQRLFAQARALGFCSAGVAEVAPFVRERQLALQAIDDGRFSGMEWYTRERVEAGSDLGARHPWGNSLLALAYPYDPVPAPVDNQQAHPVGRISAYACLTDDDGNAVDYHTLLKQQCNALAKWLEAEIPGLRHKNFIDHGWALDRAIAERAGLGFSGKHTGLITTEAGSYVFLASILLSVELPPTPRSKRNCGSCQACLPSCPTGALLQPGVIDANRCISYLTIEHRGSIPESLRPLMGTWIFGCDLCQEACPINHRLVPAPARNGTGFSDLIECLGLDAETFAERYRGTAIWRTGRNGLARNAAIALGNAADRRALPALQRAREADPDPVVREAAAWAMARLTAAPVAAESI